MELSDYNRQAYLEEFIYQNRILAYRLKQLDNLKNRRISGDHVIPESDSSMAAKARELGKKLELQKEILEKSIGISFDILDILTDLIRMNKASNAAKKAWETRRAKTEEDGQAKADGAEGLER